MHAESVVNATSSIEVPPYSMVLSKQIKAWTDKIIPYKLLVQKFGRIPFLIHFDLVFCKIKVILFQVKWVMLFDK